MGIKHGWQEGSSEKNALHALVGGIMSELTNNGFLAGASGAMINEMIQDKLSDMFKDNPAMHQWASALIGGVVAQVAADNAQMGAATASSGTKNNYLTHKQLDDMKKELAACNGNKDKERKVREKYELIDSLQDEIWLAKHTELNNYQEKVGVDLNGKDVILTSGTCVVHGDEKIKRIIENNDLTGKIIKIDQNESYYADDNGVLYKLPNHSLIENIFVQTSESLIDRNYLKNMKGDYEYLYLGLGIGKNFAVSNGGIIDKKGNVYIFDQEQVGFGASTFVYGGYGIGIIENSVKKDIKYNIVDIIAGYSSGFGASAVASSGVSVADGSNILTVEIGVESSAGTTLYARRHARYIGNILSKEMAK